MFPWAGRLRARIPIHPGMCGRSIHPRLPGSFNRLLPVWLRAPMFPWAGRLRARTPIHPETCGNTRPRLELGRSLMLALAPLQVHRASLAGSRHRRLLQDSRIIYRSVVDSWPCGSCPGWGRNANVRRTSREFRSALRASLTRRARCAVQFEAALFDWPALARRTRRRIQFAHQVSHRPGSRWD